MAVAVRDRVAKLAQEGKRRRPLNEADERDAPEETTKDTMISKTTNPEKGVRDLRDFRVLRG